MTNDLTAQAEALRAFNRFYTRQTGLLAPYLESPLTLTEARVLYELAHREQPAASEIGRALGLDPAYLSRILKRFEARGWLARTASPTDARQSLLRLGAEGRAVFDPLEARSRAAAQALLAALQPHQRAELVDALDAVQRLLAPQDAAPLRTALLREPGPGDLGWVVQQHGELYAREYGLNAEFEALVAEIVSQFVRRLRPAHERAWIAEVDGQRAGSVFVVRKSATVAQLRLLLLAPQARGMGLGGRLTDAAIDFARAKGYRRMRLWTQSCLSAARAIYAARGFQLVDSEPGRAFGQDLVGETWELRL